MKPDNSIQDSYCLFKEGVISKNEFEGRIFKYLLNNSGRYKVFDGNNEIWGDFLSWLYFRLSRAIDLYKDVGSSFDSYISALVHGAAKEYRCREADRKLTEYACWQARAEEMKLLENEPEYSENKEVEISPFDLNPKQVLFLLLKSYYSATEEMVKYVAKINCMEVSEIRRLINELRKIRSSRATEIRELKERLHLQHYRCLAYQKRLSKTSPDSDYYHRIKDRFERAKLRYNSMKKRLNTMRLTASNKMIARVMGIPPGTVDSGISAIKNRLAALKKLC